MSAGNARRRCAAWIETVLAALLLVPVAAPVGAQAPEISAPEIERRVRAVYIEGFPYTLGRGLSRDAVERLAGMLESPDERPYWSNIVLALGTSESSRALVALEAFADAAPTGEVEADVYQARAALPFAFGHLARRHDAALVRLGNRATEERDPQWSFQSLRGAALGDVLRRAAITGLGVSGRDEADAILRELEERENAAGRGASEWARHLATTRVLRTRVKREGPAAVFSPRGVRRPGP